MSNQDNAIRSRIFDAIHKERSYQQDKWGNEFDNLHSPADWWVFVTFYFSKALGTWRIDKQNPNVFDRQKLRDGLIKVAAIVVAWIEALDRNA